MNERLAFYEECSEEINDMLREVKSKKSSSDIEKLYGIDIPLCEIVMVGYSEKTMAAFEKEKQAEAAMRGAQELRKGVQEAAREFSSPGLDPEIALNAALVVTGQAKKDIHSIEGLKDLFKSSDGKLIVPEFLKGGKK